MGDHEPLRVYWQPGCSSCLQAKEFLTKHGVGFESINVLTEPGALGEMEALGARSVPVVARGTDFVAGQNLDELAAFIGVARQTAALPVDALAGRVVELMDHAQRQLAAMPKDAVSIELRPGRTLADLGYHVFAIVEGFLDAARGGELSESYFTKLPEQSWSLGQIEAAGVEVQKAFAAWRESDAETTGSLATYYGPQSLQALLERTAWHVAQHLRQIAAVVRTLPGNEPCDVPARLLTGLPMPDRVWDDERPLSVRKVPA